MTEANKTFIQNNLHKSSDVLSKATGIPELQIQKFAEELKKKEFKEVSKVEKIKKQNEDSKKNKFMKNKRGGAVAMTTEASFDTDVASQEQRFVPNHDGYAKKIYND